MFTLTVTYQSSSQIHHRKGGTFAIDTSWIQSRNDFILNVDETRDRDGNQGDGDYERQDGKVKLQ